MSAKAHINNEIFLLWMGFLEKGTCPMKINECEIRNE